MPTSRPLVQASRHAIAAQALRQARLSLLENGTLPEGLVGDEVSRSWQRSHHAGLSPIDPPGPAPVSTPQQLREALDREADLLVHARPVMAFLFDQMPHSRSMVVLSDGDGLLLHTLGDGDFLARADRVSLRAGALWREDLRGTNAIGTALAEHRSMVVHGAEHYLERHGFLTCAAATVMSPDGRLRGVLDISGDQREHHPHTFALVRSAARMIEDRLFHARHPHDRLLRLHPRAEGLGGMGEGLLALSDDGWVLGANAMAQQWLGLHARQMGALTLAQALGARQARMLDDGACGHTHRMHTPGGITLHLREDAERRRHVWTASTEATAPSAGGSEAPARLATAPTARPGPAPTPEQLWRQALKVQAQGIAVLLQGESGSGKEVFARRLHAQGPRAEGPFVAVNCAALPEGLIEAELFGYVGGAFTGARREGAPGRIRQAEGGILFLDEIGDMPLALQARLLRVLQDRCVVPVGGCQPVPVDFTLICATHHRLRDAVAAGQFREDLYWRINGFSVCLPALRERDDRAELIDDLLHALRHDLDLPGVPTVAPDLLHALLAHPWPGNLRQLHQCLRTACALLDPHETTLQWHHFSPELWQAQPTLTASRPPGPARVPEPEPGPGTHDLRRASDEAILAAVKDCGGNMTQAAKALRISRNTLYRRLRQIGTH